MKVSEELKGRILNEMVFTKDELEREAIIRDIIEEYPALDTPANKEKMRRLYHKYKLEQGGGKK